MKTIDNESRLSRWSRRKQQTLAETEQEDLDVDLQEQGDSALLTDLAAVSTGTEQTDIIVAEPEQPVLTDADMPPIEALNSESDFSMFMSSGVTDKLRNLALKQLFKAPLFNIRDGLDEYDEDYTFFEKLGDIVTCDMKHQIEVEALKKETAELESAKLEAAKNEALEDADTDENSLIEDGLEEDALAEQDPPEDKQVEDGLNNSDSVQKESDVETNETELNPEGLYQIPAKPETIEG
jgi:hypothetical protein